MGRSIIYLLMALFLFSAIGVAEGLTPEERQRKVEEVQRKVEEVQRKAAEARAAAEVARARADSARIAADAARVAAEAASARARQLSNSARQLETTNEQQAQFDDYVSASAAVKSMNGASNKAQLVGKVRMIEVMGMVTLEYVQSDENCIIVHGGMNHVRDCFQLKDGALTLTGVASAADKIEIRARDVQVISAFGQSTVKCAKFDGDGLVVNIAGAAEMHLGEVTVPEFTAKVSGLADLKCKKIDANTVNFTVAGQADVSLGDLVCVSVNADGSGSSDLKLGRLNVGRLRASVAGLSEITVDGKADNATLIYAEQGEIKLRNLKIRNIKKIDNRPVMFQ